MSGTQSKLNELLDRRASLLHGSASGNLRQHEQGKQTARERLEQLLDPGSFTELDQFAAHRCTAFGMSDKTIPGDGVVTGYGRVDGRTVFVYAQDFTASGGSLGETHAAKICKVMDLALRAGAPVVGLCDSGGARIQEGVDALGGFGEIFRRNVLCSGRIPQISVILGPCAGGAVYSPALTDFILMADKTSQMFITGPAVVEATTGESVTAEALGGAYTHAALSGVAHLALPTEQEALGTVRRLLGYLPAAAGQRPPSLDYAPAQELRPALDALIPDRPSRPYDIHHVLDQLLDPDSFLELQPWFADNVVVGFGRMGGRSVGIVADQPLALGGVLDADASDKAARFIQFCDAFGIPLITLVDVPGFLPGPRQEHAGIIRHGAKLLYVYAAAQVPKLTLVLRKAYGGAYIAMCSKHLGADLVLAWPTAEIAVMGADGAASIIFKKEIAAAQDPDAARAERAGEYARRFASPYAAAQRGFVDLVIPPAESRLRLLDALEVLADKPRTLLPRGNMPL